MTLNPYYTALFIFTVLAATHPAPDDSDEAEKLAALLGAIDRAQAPSRHQGALL